MSERTATDWQARAQAFMGHYDLLPTRAQREDHEKHVTLHYARLDREALHGMEKK